MTDRTPEQWRSLDAPFAQTGWQPIAGHCSRC